MTVEVDSLSIEAKDADIAGTIGGIGGQGAADKTIINNRGPGSYRNNGFTVLGTGPGTRTYAELSALRLSNTMESVRRPATPADAVFTSLNPAFRASMTGAIIGPYPVNVFEMPFPLLSWQPGTGSGDDELYDVFQMFR